MADQTLRENWHIPRWMKIIGVIVGAVLLIALIMYVTGNGDKVMAIVNGAWDMLKSVWLWIVGFAGSILALFQGKRKKPSIREEKKEIVKENEKIGLELKGLRNSMDEVDQWRERERKLHEREIALLERELNLKEQQLQMKEAEINKVRSMSGKELVDSLPEEKKKEVEKSMSDAEIDL